MGEVRRSGAQERRLGDEVGVVHVDDPGLVVGDLVRGELGVTDDDDLVAGLDEAGGCPVDDDLVGGGPTEDRVGLEAGTVVDVDDVDELVDPDAGRVEQFGEMVMEPT